MRIPHGMTNEQYEKRAEDDLVAATCKRYDLLRGWEQLDDLTMGKTLYATTQGRIVEYEIVPIVMKNKINYIARATVTASSGVEKVAYSPIEGREIYPTAIIRRLNRQLGIRLKRPLTKREI